MRVGPGASLPPALLLLALAAPLWAQDVRLTAPGLVVEGRALGFDGTYLRVETAEGEVTLDLSSLDCEGEGCPDPRGFVPELRLAGEAGLGAALMPALVEGYAAARGWTAERDGEAWALRDGDAVALRVGLALSSSGGGVAALAAGEADLALMGRAPTAEETAALEAAGLGGPEAWRLRPLGREALVAATGPGQRVGRVTIEDLARVFSGEASSWAELGGEDLPLRAHLGPEGSAAADAFVALVLGETGRRLAPEVVRHATEAEAAEAVAADPQAIGVLPFERLGGAQPLALRGLCGLPWVPREGAVRAGDFPLAAPVGLLQPMRRLAPAAQGFVDWLATPEAQLVLRRAGLVGTEAVPMPWGEQGERLAAAIRAAGPEVPLRELQRLVRVLGGFTRLSTTFRFEEGTRLDPFSRGLLLRLAHEVAAGRFSGRTLVLAGFSDGRGAAGENRRLSLARAEAVEEALRGALGGDWPGNVGLRVHAFGEALPMGCDEPREGPWGAEVNRRVELWVSE